MAEATQLPTPEISLLVPAHNEQESLPAFLESVTAVLAQLATPYEIIFIDDGSTDGTLATTTPIQR